MKPSIDRRVIIFQVLLAIPGDQMWRDCCNITPKSEIARALITYYFNDPV